MERLRTEEARAELADLILRARKMSPQLDSTLIDRAFWAARKAHEGQQRRSGKPYFGHVLYVAVTCAELRTEMPNSSSAIANRFP